MQMFLVCTVHEAKPSLITVPSLCWRRVLTVVVSITLLSVDLCSLLLPRDVEAILLLRVLSLLHSPKDEPCSSSRISCTVATLKKSRDGGRIGVPIASIIIHKKGKKLKQGLDDHKLTKLSDPLLMSPTKCTYSHFVFITITHHYLLHVLALPGPSLARKQIKEMCKTSVPSLGNLASAHIIHRGKLNIYSMNIS